jgi:hypothetical protein
MKLRLVAFAASFLALAALGAAAQASAGRTAGDLRPDRGEIESASSEKIVFVSYEGPSSRIDSAADIAGIGSVLGKEASGSGLVSARFGNDRYRVIRAVDPSVKEGLDADIIVLGVDAQVDHIKNLRRIIAGYLASAWGYSEKDASTLAVFVTVYNAVHRGEMKYFDAKYKSVVRKELAPENAGLALNYAEWPGKSRIVIPLSSGAKPGSLGAVDTGAVSDKKVVESLKAEPGKGVADRQALVDVKEREAADKQADADKKKAELAAAEKKLADDKAKAEADRAALEADKKKAAAAASAAAPTAPASPGAAASPAAPAGEGAAAPGSKAATAPGSKAATAPGSKAATAPGSEAATAELAKKEAEVKAEEAQVKQQEAAVADKKEAAAAAQGAAVAKKEEAASDRKEITADQKEVIATQVADKGKTEAAGVYLVRVGDDPNHLAQIVFVDSGTGKGIRSSRITSLHTRSLSELADAFVAVVGLEGKQGGVKLVKLDKASLESVAESKSEMFGESSILVSGGSLYAIVNDGGAQYLARFAAADLSEKARSKEVVAPYSLIREAAGGVVVQAPTGGGFVVLKADSLEKSKGLTP